MDLADKMLFRALVIAPLIQKTLRVKMLKSFSALRTKL